MDRIRDALRRYLDWMDGFEESGLYKDYREACGFTDDEWCDTLAILDAFVAPDEGVDSLYPQDCGSCGADIYPVEPTYADYPWHLVNEDCRAIRTPIDRKEGKERQMTEKSSGCEICRERGEHLWISGILGGSKGILVSLDRDTATIGIERCDGCKVFGNDSEAAAWLYQYILADKGKEPSPSPTTASSDTLDVPSSVNPLGQAPAEHNNGVPPNKKAEFLRREDLTLAATLLEIARLMRPYTNPK